MNNLAFREFENYPQVYGIREKFKSENPNVRLSALRGLGGIFNEC